MKIIHHENSIYSVYNLVSKLICISDPEPINALSIIFFFKLTLK